MKTIQAKVIGAYVGGKPLNMPGGLMTINIETKPPAAEHIKHTPAPWYYEDTTQISAKRLKRLLRKMPKRKKSRLPRKLKKRMLKRMKNKSAGYVNAVIRIKALSYNMKRNPYMKTDRIPILSEFDINFQAAEKRVLSSIGLPPPFGPIKVEGVDALYTIKPNGGGL